MNVLKDAFEKEFNRTYASWLFNRKVNSVIISYINNIHPVYRRRSRL